MKNERKIKELKQLIKDYELIIEIHTSNKELSSSKGYSDYVDSILDEILEIKKLIKRLEEE